MRRMKPRVTMPTATPRPTPRRTRKTRIGFNPMAMKRDRPMMMRTLEMSAMPRSEEVGHGDAESARKTDEERRAVIERASERPQGLVRLVELPLHARRQDQDAIRRRQLVPRRPEPGESPGSNVIAVSHGQTTRSSPAKTTRPPSTPVPLVVHCRCGRARPGRSSGRTPVARRSDTPDRWAAAAGRHEGERHAKDRICRRGSRPR